MNRERMYRQGDVLLKEIEKCEGVEIAQGMKILAYGEATGHKHILKGEKVRFYETTGGQVQVQVERTAQLVHDEHEEIEIPAGNYQVVLQREFDLVSGVRQVMD